MGRRGVSWKSWFGPPQEAGFYWLTSEIANITIKRIFSNNNGELFVDDDKYRPITDNLYDGYFWIGPIHTPKKPSQTFQRKEIIQQLCRKYNLDNKYKITERGLFLLLHDISVEEGAADELQAWAWACKRGRELGIHPKRGTTSHINKVVGEIKKYTR
jgi:hypothetical protein